RDHVIDQLTYMLDESGDKAGCAQLALEEAPKLERGPVFANVAGDGLSCALETGAHIDELVPLAVEAIDAPNVGADRGSELYQLLVEVAKKRGDEATARTWAQKWIQYLEASARAEKTPEARAVYDAHRLSAALELGEPERVVPALEQSEKDLPNDFN